MTGYVQQIYTDIQTDMQDMYRYRFGYPDRYLVPRNSPEGPKDISDIHRYPKIMISKDIRGILTYQ
jgi:hypothetical protein